jgi:hypothetical protein
MKAETAPITADEWLLRLVWEDRVTTRVPIISPNSFEPRKAEIEGISFYRAACLNDPTDALIPFAEDKRPRYAIVQIPVHLLTALGLSVRPAPTPTVPGHVVVPEINITDYSANKARFTPIKLRLAEVASENILRRPVRSSSD